MHKHIGVRYIYEELGSSDRPAASRDRDNVLTAAALADLPGAIVADLKEAPIEGDLDLMASSIELIRSDNAPLA